MTAQVRRLQFELAILLFCGLPYLASQTVPVDSPSTVELKNLAASQRWSEIVSLLAPIHSRPAEMDFYYGTALARLNRWPEAESEFEAGRRLAPTDPRFPVELAAIAFKQKQYSRAAQRLRQALKFAPGDSYTNDFLATVYFLEGNLTAALKYWNRAGKPMIAEVQMNPDYRVSPALLDRAFAFSPAATLLLPEFLDSERRVAALGIFPLHHFDLVAREDGQFDVVFNGAELNGFGDTKWESLFTVLRGLPFQGVSPEYYNLHREAINIQSLFRWDDQKRRIFADLSGPFEHSAVHRFELVTDLRDENWVVRDSFTGPAPVLASLNLRHQLAAFELASSSSYRLRWSVGAELSHRDFRSIAPGAILTQELLATGFQLKQTVQLTAAVFQAPERRFTVDARASSQMARLWSSHPESFEKLQTSIGSHWFPRAVGDDYETSARLRAGGTLGQDPFDELFMLGLERDNDLPMRAHIGTRDGQKGSAPLGRDYLLASYETDKNLYASGLIRVTLGPTLDIGRISGVSSLPGEDKWLWDLGAQAKLHILGSGFVFSYGKDLRSGNNAFYLRLLP